MVRRERLEIVKAILELCITPRKKTAIVYQCNLNFKIVRKYLIGCFANGWLIKNGVFYETTNLGKDYLNLITPTVESIETIYV